MSRTRRPPVLPRSIQQELGINAKKHKRPDTRSKREPTRRPEVRDRQKQPHTNTRLKQSKAREDADIAGLEKKLRLKDGKLPKSLAADGLDDLLEGLDNEDESRKRKREGRDWLDRKRRKFRVSGSEEEDEEDSSQETDDVLQSSGSDLDSSDDTTGGAHDSTGDEASESLGKDAGKMRPPSRRENPYVAPIQSDRSTAKYVPPSLRMKSEQQSDSMIKLQRQAQGHLNKLSESNLIPIMAEFEKLYQTQPRQEVSTVLVDHLMTTIGQTSVLQQTYVALHAAFASAIYKVIGTSFGAQLVAAVVSRLDENLAQTQMNTGKSSNNLISFLCYLFVFGVTSSAITFDYTKLLLRDLKESSAELLLRIVRDCGPQLRQDNPLALKEAVRIMGDCVSRLGREGQELSVRTKVLIETISDLKNNKMRSKSGLAKDAIEHVTRLKKVLGTLNSRTLKTSEPLGITRQDVLNSDKKGKWWLVGASWKGDDAVNGKPAPDQPVVENTPNDEMNLNALARQFGMNTEVRRAIFVALMSANDYQDAFIRLKKLNLKRTQEQEISKVLLRCAGAEERYNPYYTLVVKRLCNTDKKMIMSFQFGLWNFFRRIGERGDLDNSDADDGKGAEDEVKLEELVNFAKMYGTLIGDGSLPIGVLKTLDLNHLTDRGTNFAEVLMVTLLSNSTSASNPQHLESVLSKAAEVPHLARGLNHFLKHNIRTSDLVRPERQKTLSSNCKRAEQILKHLLA